VVREDLKMNERGFEDRLRGYLSGEVQRAEPAGWWDSVIPRLPERSPQVSLGQRLRGMLSSPAWSVAIPVALVAIVFLGLWQMGVFPASTPAGSQVDFIKLNGITYISHFRSYDLTASDLSPFSEISHRVQGTQRGHQLKDGDAAFLDAGTPVYSLAGYQPTFRLAAMREGKWYIYEVDTNPGAARGSDLLDIGGKVEYIAITSHVDRSQLGLIGGESVVNELVNMILEAPVEQMSATSGEQYFLEFHLKDGTTSTSSYLLDANTLNRGIRLPNEFRDVVIEAVGN
jgi:hypothetical protein